MNDIISLLQVTPFQSHNLYEISSKRVKWRLSYTTMTHTYLNGNMEGGGGGGGGGGDTSMAQDA